MRYLRMLSNSLVGGAIGAAYLAVLVLQLNPDVRLNAANVAPLYLALELSYGLHLAATFYVLIVLRQLLAFEVDSPRWISGGVLTWCSGAAASGAAALMWLNRRTFSAILPDDTARRLTTGAGWMTACAVLFFLLGLVHYSFGRRGGRVASALYALALTASLSLPLAARGTGTVATRQPPRAPVRVSAPALPSPRVVMILLDGASLNAISAGAAEGRLLNFARMLDSGASMYLSTLRPTQPAPVWAAVATGKLPTKNGVRAAARYRIRSSDPFDVLPDYCFAHLLVRFGFVSEQPHTSADFTALPIWDLLSRADVSVGIVGWPLSYPVRPVNGYLVSENLRAVAASALTEDGTAVYPADALAVARTIVEAMQADSAAGSAASLANADRSAIDRALFANDRMLEQVAGQLQAAVQPRLAVMRYRGLDTAGHDFLRYADPGAFGDVSDQERRAFGRVLPTAYGVMDEVIGRALSSLGPDDLLVVVSGFGMEPLGLGKRWLEKVLNGWDKSGTHERGPDGFLLAYGGAVAPGRRPPGALVDVLPTLLYFFGLPVGHDMDGAARTDLFSKAFTEERPITFIPTYER
ncbi:MAG: alkaline phosphatase family protein [Bacteroidales bacterium]